MANLDLSATLELIDRISAPLQSIVAQSERLNQAFEKTTASVEQFNETLSKVNSSRLNGLNQPLNQTNSLFSKAREHARGLASDLKLVFSAIVGVQKKADSLAKSFADYRKGLREQAMGSIAKMGGAAMLSSIPIKAFMEAESASTDLKVSMMDSTGKIGSGFKELNDLATKMGNKLPGSFTDFQKMFNVLIKENISAEKILSGLGESAGQVGVIMKMEFSDAAKFVAQLSDATNVASKDMMAFMDTVQRINYTGLDPEWIKQGFVGLAPGMKTLRMEGIKGVKALSPFLTMLGNSGMTDGGSAGNAMSKIFSASLDMDVPNKLAKLKNKYGIDISLDFTDGNGGFGGVEKFYQQMDKLATLNAQQRDKVIETIYGTDKESMFALNTIINKGKAGYDQTLAQMQAQASLQQRINAQLGTLANMWDAAKGTFTTAMVNFVEAFAPQLRQLITDITELAQKIGDWAKANPELIKTIGSLLLKFIKLNLILFTIKYSVALVLGSFFGMLAHFIKFGAMMMLVNAILAKFGISFWGKFRLMGQAVMMFARLFGRAFIFLARQSIPFVITAIGQLATVLLTTPIGWAIVAIAVAALLIYKYWAPIKAFFAGFWQGFLAGLQPLMTTLSSLWSMLGQIFAPLKPVIDAIVFAIGWLASAFMSLFAPAQMTQAQLAGATSAGQSFGMILGTIVGLIGQVVAGLVGDLALGLQTIGQAIGTFAAMVVVHGGQAVAYVASLPGRFMAFLAGLPGQMSAMGGQIMDGLKNGIMSRINGVVSSIQSAASRIKSAFAGMMGIHSPSRVFMGYGDNIMAGLNNGLLANNAPIQSMIRTSDNLRSAMDTSQIKFDTRKPITASMANGGYANAQSSAPININIYPQPNQSPADIAQLVAQELAKAKLGQTTNNTALYDLPQAWT